MRRALTLDGDPLLSERSRDIPAPIAPAGFEVPLHKRYLPRPARQPRATEKASVRRRTNVPEGEEKSPYNRIRF
jgi:hypothetical protein